MKPTEEQVIMISGSTDRIGKRAAHGLPGRGAKVAAAWVAPVCAFPDRERYVSGAEPD